MRVRHRSPIPTVTLTSASAGARRDGVAERVRRSAGWVALSIAALALTGCGDESSGGDVFDKEVVPVLQARCASVACHGQAPGAVGAGEVVLDEHFTFSVDDAGRIRNTEAVRAEALRFVNTVEGHDFSSLIREPLPEVWGGTAHSGGDNFTSRQDPGYQAFVAWIEEETAGGEDPDDAGLTELQQFYAGEVQPVLLARSCATANCHGPLAVAPYHLDPGITTDTNERVFSQAMLRANYAQSRLFLSLDGDPSQSRLLRKGLPLHDGGITQRGGNQAFFEDMNDPGVEPIIAWAEMEREVEMGADAPTEPSGIVFVRGPVEPTNVFDVARFVPGSDIWLQTPPGPGGAEANLTADLHAMPADVRDPSVSPEGTHIVFSMRVDEAGGHQIWELELASGEARQITDDPARLPSGAAVGNVMPVYGPDDMIYFASNRADILAERADALDVDLYRVPRSGGEPERLTFTPGPEIEPTIYRQGPFPGYLMFEYRRSVDVRDETVGFFFPVDQHVDYHIFFGVTPVQDHLHQFRQMPDGRQLVIAGDRSNVWDGGQLAILDRNMGPDLLPEMNRDDVSVFGYAQSLRVIDGETSHTGVSDGGIYRDPVAMPDGTILAAWAPGPVDLTDPDAAPDFRIVHLTVREADDGCVAVSCMPSIETAEVWVDETGVGDTSPEVVMPYSMRFSGGSVLDPNEPALFSMVDIVVNDAIMTALPPLGEKRFADDARYVRFIEALPQSPDDWSPIPASEVANQDPNSTTTTNGVHMPARILAEVDLYEDKSLFVDLPPGVAFRTQLLDENRMNVGLQHNRWIYNWPGQHFAQSTQRHLYDQGCAPCHGATSGDAEDLLFPPDITTRATVSFARFVDRNPRIPRDPLVIGDATRIEVSFLDDVQPILDASCNDSGCHDAAAAGGLDLTDDATIWYNVAYEALLADGPGSAGGNAYIDEASSSARGSYLIELITGTELDAPRELGEHPAIGLSDDDILTLVRWIEVGAHYELP